MVNCSRCGSRLTSPSACTNCGTTAGQKSQKKGRHLLLRKFGIATFPFEATLQGQLSFDTAEIFQLHQEIDENWFQATSVDYNTNGLVPKSHISLIPESSEIYKKYCGDENSLVNKANDKQVKRSSMALYKFNTNNFFFSTFNHVLYQIFMYLNLKELEACRLVSKNWNKLVLKSLHSSHRIELAQRIKEKKAKTNENVIKEKYLAYQKMKIWKEDPFCLYMQPYPLLPDHNINVDESFTVNVCLLGSGTVGKTSLVHNVLNTEIISNVIELSRQTEPPKYQFNDKYVSTAKNETHQKRCKIDGENILFNILDTTQKKEDQDQAIMKSHLFLLIYSINDKASFSSIEKLHQQITTIHSQKAYLPILLVATKADLPDSSRLVSFDEGLSLSKSLKLDGFFETSSKNSFFVDDLFINVARAYSLSVVLHEQASQLQQREKELTSSSSSSTTPKIVRKLPSVISTPRNENNNVDTNKNCCIF